MNLKNKKAWNKGLTKEIDKRIKKQSNAILGEKHFYYGKHRSDEVKRKISEALKGRHLSDEHKGKISIKNKNRIAWNKGLTKETDKRVAKYSKPHSNETKKKISNSLRGKNHPLYGKHHSKNHKQKISNSLKGKHHSEKTKEKLSIMNKGKRLSEKTKRKISKAKRGCKSWNKGKHLSEEHRQKLTESNLRRVQNNLGPFKNTKPELKMKEILSKLNIPFKHQFRLRNHNFDFYILNSNILIEVDGDYWHGNPKMFKKLSKMQLEQRIKDDRNNKLAKENNFILLRFWENDILRNEEIVKNKLENLIGA